MSKQTVIACLGDSLTWGFPYGTPYSWVNLVSQRTGLKMINLGLNGNTTEDMLHRFPFQVLPAKPTHVVLMGGTNDIIMQETFPRITLNLQNLVEMAQKHKIIPILGLPIPLGWKEAEVRLERIRAWMRDLARTQNLKVIDFNRAFYQVNSEGEWIPRWELMLDGSHPAIEGYIAMADQFDPAALGLSEF